MIAYVYIFTLKIPEGELDPGSIDGDIRLALFLADLVTFGSWQTGPEHFLGFFDPLPSGVSGDQRRRPF
jgi:hypothetical protein